MDHPLSAVNVEHFFDSFTERFALWGAAVSVDYESGKWHGRSVSRRYQEKSRASLYFSSTRKTWQTNNRWMMMDGFVL